MLKGIVLTRHKMYMYVDHLQRLLVTALAYNAPVLERNFLADDLGLGATPLQGGPAPSNATTL